MASYHFLTTWILESPRQPVWDAIYDSDSWHEWWEGVEETERLADGDENGIGQYGRYVWKAKLPYRVEFFVRSTRVQEPFLLEGVASGELAGTGRWRFLEQDGVTAVIYEWNVRSTKRWMNALAPLAAPVFRANHDWVMRNGGKGLAERLRCRLLASD